MPARWNLRCAACPAIEADVLCSMYIIPPCPTCGGERTISNDRGMFKTSLFPYTLNHVDGKPMVIESMAHLRQVEKRFGVTFSAFSKDNVNDVDPLKDVAVYRGDDPEFRRR